MPLATTIKLLLCLTIRVFTVKIYLILLINQQLPHIRKETIEQLFEQPYIAPKALVGKGIKSVNTAKKYCQQMEKLGILTSEKVGKQVIYLNIDLFNLLADT